MADIAFHGLIQKLNSNLRITLNREFFEITPWDAYDVLESMAIIHDRQDKLYRNRNNIFFNDPEELTYDISNHLWSAAQYAFRFDEQTNTDYIKAFIEQTYVQVK